MVEIGLVVGYVIAWALRKGRRVAERLDQTVDAGLDAGLDRLHGVVASKLGADPALKDMEEEAGADGQVSDLTRRRLELSLMAAAQKDDLFEKAVAELAAELRRADPQGGVLAVGQGTAAVAGDVHMSADHGSIVGWNMRDVSLGPAPADPPAPGRSRD
jgi:hypothetical protein